MLELNPAAVANAASLINRGAYDDQPLGDARFPDPADLAAYIQYSGWDAYARWFLAVDPDQDERSLTRYRLPVGNLDHVSREALQRALDEADRYGAYDVERAVERLLYQLDED